MRAFATTFLARLFGAGAMIALGAVVARLFGRGPRGVIEVLADVRLGVHAVGSLGLPAAMTWAVARDPADAVPASRDALVVGLAVGAACALALAAAILLRPDRFDAVGVGWSLAFVASSPAILATLLAGGVLLGAGRVTEWNALTIVNRGLLGVALALAYVPALRRTDTVMAGLVAAEWATFAYAWRCLSRLGPGATDLRLDRDLLARLRRFGRTAWAQGALSWALVRVDVLLLLALAGETAAGTFAVASLAREVVLFSPWIAGMLFLPRVAASAAGRGERGRAMPVPAVLVTLAAATVLLVFAGSFTTGVHGPGYADAATATRILVVSGLLFGVGNLLLQYLLGRGAPRATAIAPGAGLVVSLAGNLYAIPRYGAVGAAWVAVASAAVLVTVAGYAARRLEA